MKNASKKLIKKIVNVTLKDSSNSTTCLYVYQPKAPAALKKFSKIDNDR